MKSLRYIRSFSSVAIVLLLALCLASGVGLAEDGVSAPPTLAFGIVVDAGASASLPYLHADPNDGAEVVSILPFGTTVEVSEEADEQWFYVHTAPYDGYVRKEHLKLYWSEDIFVFEPATLYEHGTYTVGIEFPAGLYVFEVLDEGVQTLEISLNGDARTYELTGGYGVFTYYLPDQATVTLSEGTFVPLEDRGYNFSDYEARYAEIGRFLTCKNVSAGYFNIELAPGETSGYYVVSSFAQEEDLSVQLQRVEVLPGILYEITLQEGMFIEFFNCYSPGNG